MDLFFMFWTSGNLRNTDLIKVFFHLYFLTNGGKFPYSLFSYTCTTHTHTHTHTHTNLLPEYSTTSHRCHVGDVLRLFAVRGEPHDAHVQREHNFRLRVDQVLLVAGGRRHVEEAGGQLGDSVPAAQRVVAEPVGLRDLGDPLQHLVQGLLHGHLLLQLLDHLEDDGGLLDRIHVLEGGAVLGVEGRAEGGRQGLGANLLVEVLFGELRVVLQVLLHAVLVCHFGAGFVFPALCVCVFFFSF